MGTSDEMFDDRYYGLRTYEKNWLLLKDCYWYPNEQGQIYLDNTEHILVVERQNKGLVLGYLHAGSSLTFIGADLSNFISSIKTLCIKKKWDSYELIIATDFELRMLNHYSITKLPADIKYISVSSSSICGKKPSGPYIQCLKSATRDSYNRKYHYRKRSSSNYSSFDSEESIMRALKNGDGDLYGL